MEYVAGYPADRLPDAGGVNATVVATMGLDSLLGGLQAAQLDTGEPISAALARRLACAAGIIPAVLGTKSEPLDLGRRTRFHTAPQRIALAIDQSGCTAEGGETTVKNGRLLCPRHHARAHDPTYTMTRLPGSKVTFQRRT